MPKQNTALFAFNRGLVGGQALARVDLERMRMSAERQNNWLPRSLGSMTLRPGLQYLLPSRGNAVAIGIQFIRAIDDTAILECTDSILRPLVNEAAITRASVSTTVTNGDFSSATGWTVTSVGGATGTISGGVLTISCEPIDSYVTVSRSVTVSAPDQATEHALRIIVTAGPVTFRCGTALHGDDLIAATSLRTGNHSIAFTPGAATIYVELESHASYSTQVDSIQIEAAGEMTLPAPWSATDLPYLRTVQSADIIFFSRYGHQQGQIERRGTRSWSVVTYTSNDGPFFAAPTDSTIKMSVSGARSNVTITANRPFFKSSHVGSLIRLFTPGYDFAFLVGQEDCYTPPVRINGVGAARSMTIVTTGTWVGTLRVQKSYVGEDSGFTNTGTAITTNTTTAITDTADNVAVWVRVGFGVGDYTSGLANVQPAFGISSTGLVFQGTSTQTSIGGRTGIARITGWNSATSVAAVVLSIFSSTQKTTDWAESEWSDKQGWPSCVGIHESRLCWAGRDKFWGSVSDSYYSYSLDVVGDSGTLQRSIGVGPIQIINWLLPMTRLAVGTEAAEFAVRSSSFDEPLTPTNFVLKDFSSYGSARVDAAKVDRRGIYVDKSSQRVMEISYDLQSNDSQSADLTRLCPDLFLNNGIVKIAVQRQPDTRIHCIRHDGTVAVVVYEPLEDVRCWWTVETDGTVEDVVVLPSAVEDKVYYLVNRTINGVTKRYWERFAREDECVGATLNKQADSFILYSGAPTTTITGLSHLEGEEVIVWGDGVDLSPTVSGVQTTYTVTGGSITISPAVSSAVIGLPYTAQFKSVKLAYAAAGGTALTQTKRVNQLGLILHKTHYQGVKAGKDFDTMDNLPLVVNGATVAANTIHAHYDHPMQTFKGSWDADSRLCLEANAPRPATILAAIIEVNTSG